MKYGCIGEQLSHSFSKEIHNALADYEYEIREIPRDGLKAFVRGKDFFGINVTIPYKELIIPYLDEIDGAAKKIGAVNTVVNKDGRLFGYNTDFFGMSELIHHAGIEVLGKKAAILGSGGTAKTARAVLNSLGAKEIVSVSRRPSEHSVDYESFLSLHRDTEIIVNTTPVGMYPATDDAPISIDGFDNLSGVIDAIYNPLRSRLVSEALKRKIPASGGLYMLVAQAVKASEIFLNTTYPEGTLNKISRQIERSKENIVLIGMPSSGKTTVGKILAKKLSRELYDSDEKITNDFGSSIPDIFEKNGEEYFRELESNAIKELSKKTASVIATGGGAVLRRENIAALAQNGVIYFIDRPLESLMPTEDRPTASTREMIEKRHRERLSLYRSSANVIIDASATADEVANRIIEDFCK